jgi:hypothetical protein
LMLSLGGSAVAPTRRMMQPLLLSLNLLSLVPPTDEADPGIACRALLQRMDSPYRQRGPTAEDEWVRLRCDEVMYSDHGSGLVLVEPPDVAATLRVPDDVAAPCRELLRRMDMYGIRGQRRLEEAFEGAGCASKMAADTGDASVLHDGIRTLHAAQ